MVQLRNQEIWQAQNKLHLLEIVIGNVPQRRQELGRSGLCRAVFRGRDPGVAG
jgi:hypothetical protein